MIQKIISRESFSHPVILGAIGAVVVIALGSVWYFVAATRSPAVSTLSGTTTPETVTGSGIIAPSQNPDLSFQSSGRVSRVLVQVGAAVRQGQTLASLDTSALSAQRAQAVANLKTQQAKLDEMKAGPREIDLAAKHTAVDQAKASLASLRVSINSNIAQAYDKSFSGVSANADALFNQPNSQTPTLAFKSSDSQKSINAENQRGAVGKELLAWKKEVETLAGDSGAVDANLSSAVAHLSRLRAFSDVLLEALNTAVPSASFPQSSIAAAQTSIGSFRDSINAQIIALQALEQQETGGELAVTAATDSLNQASAGATSQAIDAQAAQVESAQASIDAIDAQIRNALVIAPFSGTVSSVHAKVGDMVLSGAPVVSLNPQSALQITVYLTEIDIAKIHVGELADVTLDAYGTERHWRATVVTVDSSPTAQSGATGYRTVLQFAQTDPAVSAGMTANITITVAAN